MKGIDISMESIMVAAMIAPAMSEDASTRADMGDVALIYDCWAGCEAISTDVAMVSRMYGTAIFEVVS